MADNGGFDSLPGRHQHLSWERIYNMITIGISELKALIDKGCYVYLYPRKLTVTINGGKYRKVTKSTANWMKGYTK